MAGALDPLEIGRVRLKNRLVLPPMQINRAAPDGEVTDRVIEHYVQRAPHLGLVIVEHTYVDPGGKLSPRQLGIYDDGLVAGLTRLAAAIRAQGTPAVIQLNHAGSRTTSKACGRTPVAPSAIPHPEGGETPQALSEEAISNLVAAFAAAADRACRAGFDGVEVHGAHGFLLNLFLSPISNQRDDAYGGGLEQRVRFALEAVRAVRETLGDRLLLFRLGADDRMPGGNTLAEGVAIANLLVEAGVDVLDVSGGLCGSRPSDLTGPGFFLPQAEAVRRNTRVPVIGVGGITEAHQAQEAVAQGRCDLVAVGRAQLKDPAWAERSIAELKSIQ